jgi:integrase
MARQVEGPWFRQSKGTWYATLNGRKVSLGVKGEASKPAAVKAWHRLMADGHPTAPPPVPPARPPAGDKPASPVTVKAVADAFTASREGLTRPATLTVYRCLLAHVVNRFGTLPASGLTADAFGRWLASLPLSASSKNTVGGVAMTAFRWAEATGLIPANPLRGLRRPPKASRGAKAVVTADAHRKLLEAATPALRPLLAVLRETGCRPSEAASLTAADVDIPNGVAVLTRHKTAHHTGKPRVVVLTPAAVDVLRPLMAEYPDGPLLRNGRGRPWTKDAVVLAVRRAADRAGVRATAYGYRHTYATDALAAGVPDAHVAALLGHSSTAMLHKHYSHLGSRADVLRQAAARVRG